jgi:HD-GYP domain-containing protein (c-di-GMP phosphodiesterase class II)
MCVAEALQLDAEAQLGACYAGLLHDIGVIRAGAEVASLVRGDERLVFASLPLLSPEEAVAGLADGSDLVISRVSEHTMYGASAALELELPDAVARAIATHHERWEGSGYPQALLASEAPLLGRIVALADHVESLVDQASPLLARRNFSHWLNGLEGYECDAETVAVLGALGRTDSFWLGLHSADMVLELSSRCSRLREPKGARLLPMAESFARLVDSRFSFTVNVSARVAHYADGIGRAAGLSELRRKQLRVAALLHDVGQLSMSERILAKPGILSVDELGALQLHTIYSRDVVEGIAGMEEVAEWVAAHHERMDGRGYPEGRGGAEIPLEARILAVADAFVAITSDRPHRPKVDGDSARERLRSAAGTQLDAELVDLFLRNVLG